MIKVNFIRLKKELIFMKPGIDKIDFLSSVKASMNSLNVGFVLEAKINLRSSQ